MPQPPIGLRTQMKTIIRTTLIAAAAGASLLLSACAGKDVSADERVQRAEAAAERAEAAQAKAEQAAQKAVAFSSHGDSPSAGGGNQPTTTTNPQPQAQGANNEGSGTDPKPDNPLS